MIERGQRYDPSVIVPNQYIIYQKGRLLSGHRHTGINSEVHEAARRADIERSVSNHPLLRKGLRLAYFERLPLVEITVRGSVIPSWSRPCDTSVSRRDPEASVGQCGRVLEKVRREMRDGTGPVRVSASVRILR